MIKISIMNKIIHKLTNYNSIFYETCNFTNAAKRCFVSQPSLTQSIKKLEDEVGGSLFHRDKNNIRPTALGRKIYPDMEKILAGKQKVLSCAQDFLKFHKSHKRLQKNCRVGWVQPELRQALSNLLLPRHPRSF